MLGDFDFGDAEVAAERGEGIEVDGADDVDDGELFGAGDEDGDAVDLFIFAADVDLVVFAFLTALPADDAGPFRAAKLLADAFEIGGRPGAGILEFEGTDVDAFEGGDHFLDLGFVGVFGAEEAGSELEGGAVEREVDGIGSFGGEVIEIEFQLLGREQSGGGGDQGKRAEGGHRAASWMWAWMWLTVTAAMRKASMTCSLATRPWCWRQAAAPPVMTTTAAAAASQRLCRQTGNGGRRPTPWRTRSAKSGGGSLRASVFLSSCSNQSIFLLLRRGARVFHAAGPASVANDS